MYINTHSGKMFTAEIDLKNIDINDIAHALSHQCRFTGHTGIFYSVAQHCVGVSHLADQGALAGLLHDASEAYIADIAKPWKHLLPDYAKLEKSIQAAICAKFNVDTSTVSLADFTMMQIEVAYLFPTTYVWDFDTHYTPYWEEQLPITWQWCWTPEHARFQFMKRFKELTNERDV